MDTSKTQDRIQKRIAINLVHARMEYGITRVGLAHNVGITSELLHKYEKGELPVPSEDLHAIASELGVDPEWF